MLSGTRRMALAIVLTAVPAWASFDDVTIVKKGAELHQPASVNVSPTGRLFVTETGRGRILELHPVTGEILSRITSDQGAFGPSDLAFDASGRTIYWNNFLSGEIFKRDLVTGVSTRLADFNGIVDSLAVNYQGRVFAAQLAPTPALWEVDPNGSNPPVLIALVPGMDGVDAGPDGNVYAPDFFTGTGTVRKINVDTGAVTVVASGLEFPISVKFNGRGQLHVAEYFKGTISRIDLVTGQKTLAARELPGIDNFDFDEDGRIFAANIVDNSVKRLFPGGGFRFLTRAGIASPGPVAVRTARGRESVYVSSMFSISKVSASSGRTEDLIQAAGVPHLPSLAQSLFDDGTNFITTSFILNLVQVINPDTKQVVAFHTDFATPVNAIRFQGELAVAELGTGRVVRGSDRVPFISNLVFPAGLAATDDDLFVADRATGIIYQAVKDGVIQSTPLIIKTGLAEPEGMALDRHGNLLVAETGAHRLVRINPSTRRMDVIARDLSIGLPALVGWPPVGIVLTGVAVSPSGTIYIAGDIDNVLYRIRDDQVPLAWDDGDNHE
jgi:sugar lactone lactonase YvrE